MLRESLFLGLLLTTIGCSSAAAPPAPGAALPPAAVPPVSAAEPLLPPVDATVIGMPGAPVPGLAAVYVWTGPGWLGDAGDVVFEAVIQWDYDLSLGCGILRRAPDGRVHTLLMQGQQLTGTGGGTVRHPQLPLEAHGDDLVLPAQIENGTTVQGLFLVARDGGEPRLVATDADGEFVRAHVTASGVVVAELVRDHEISVVAIDADGARVLCADCEPGVSTDGRCVVVVQEGDALRVALDGVVTPVLGRGDPAPGSGGAVTGVRAAWVTPTGDIVVHADTDDAGRPDVLVRFDTDGTASVVAACGAPAPGTSGEYGTIVPAAGGGADVVFGATLLGDPARPAAIFCAREGAAAELLIASGERAPGLDAVLVFDGRGAVAAGDGGATFGAQIQTDAGDVAAGVFLRDASGTERVLTTDARVPAIAGATLAVFDAHASDGARTLVHAGLALDRRPGATLGALLLVGP